MLRSAGYDELAQDRQERPRAETGPATDAEVGGFDRARVHVTSSFNRPAAQPKRKGGGLSWGATVSLALLLGAAVYFLVRFIRPQ